ncbi:hypothetical protein WDV06_36855 [Streptomyces racemochromogenes]|uniref:Uncharacterized protein n=1 Tax=Streptomyces racemochromogenes TaxID=67353 RepID=A0ABW7PQD1_9ACTN
MFLTAILALAMSATPQPLYTETSHAGESLDAFATRIAARAVEESLQVSGEICGEIRSEGDGHAVSFYTVRHQTACSYLREPGHTYTGLTYHTHIFIGVTNTDTLRQKIYSPRFSEEDYSHPGYMTTGKVTLFQDGSRGSVRRVSSR